MKVAPLKFTALMLLMTNSITSHVRANEGGSGAHGGDIKLIQKADVRSFIENSLRDELKQTLSWVVFMKFNSESADAVLQDMIREMIAQKPGLLEDIAETKDSFESTCLADVEESGKTTRVKRSASTRALKKDAICWSVDFILRDGAEPMQSDLVALGFHEFIHHFGYADIDHRLASRFKSLHLKRIKSDDETEVAKRVTASSSKPERLPLPPACSIFVAENRFVAAEIIQSKRIEGYDFSGVNLGTVLGLSEGVSFFLTSGKRVQKVYNTGPLSFDWVVERKRKKVVDDCRALESRKVCTCGY